MRTGGGLSARLYRGNAATEPAFAVSALPGDDPRLFGRTAQSRCPPASTITLEPECPMPRHDAERGGKGRLRGEKADWLSVL